MALPLIAHDLEVVQCGTCGIVHAIPRVRHQTAQREGGYWHCPNGHERGYRKGTEATDLDRVRAELEAERERKTAALARANDAERERDQALTVLRRERRRTAAGTCPCCKRTFSQLARHMADKHPDHGRGLTRTESIARAKRRSTGEVKHEQA